MNRCPKCGGAAYAVALRKDKVKMECDTCKVTWLTPSKICPQCHKPNGFTVPGLCTKCYEGKVGKKFAVYKGNDFLFMGGQKECVEFLGCSESTFRFYTSPVNLKRAEKKGAKDFIVVVRIEDDDEE